MDFYDDDNFGFSPDFFGQDDLAEWGDREAWEDSQAEMREQWRDDDAQDEVSEYDYPEYDRYED